MAKLASTPFNQFGPAPPMPLAGVSYITGNTGRSVEAEKLNDQTFELATVLHSASSPYDGADCAASQRTTTTTSKQAAENSTAPNLENYTTEANNLRYNSLSSLFFFLFLNSLKEFKYKFIFIIYSRFSCMQHI